MVKRVIRVLTLGIGLVLVAVGALALGSAYLADYTAVIQVRSLVESALLAAGPGRFEFLPVDVVYRMDPFLSHALVLYGFAPLGLVLAIAMLLPGKGKAVPGEGEEPRSESQTTAYVEPKDKKKAAKAAASMAKSGSGEVGDWRGEAALLAKEVAGLDHWLTSGEKLPREWRRRKSSGAFFEQNRARFNPHPGPLLYAEVIESTPALSCWQGGKGRPITRPHSRGRPFVQRR